MWIWRSDEISRYELQVAWLTKKPGAGERAVVVSVIVITHPCLHIAQVACLYTKANAPSTTRTQSNESKHIYFTFQRASLEFVNVLNILSESNEVVQWNEIGNRWQPAKRNVNKEPTHEIIATLIFCFMTPSVECFSCRCNIWSYGQVISGQSNLNTSQIIQYRDRDINGWILDMRVHINTKGRR